MSLESFWYVAGLSKDLRRSEVKAAKLLARPIALFRDGEGRARALLDSCPHRGFPLSKGSCVDGALRCNYHGWRFDGAGRCTLVPGLAADAPAVRAEAQAFATREQNGLIWVWGRAGETPSRAPIYLPLADDRAYLSEHVDFGTVQASTELVLDNFMDSAHPPFVHPGLLSSDVKRTLIDLEIRPCAQQHANDTWAGLECAYLNEPFADFSLFVKLFGRRSSTIEHYERFFPPSLHQFEYRLGPKTHFVSTQFVCPEDDQRSRIFALYHFRFSFPHVLARWPFGWLFRHLLRQDQGALETLQRARAEHAPARDSSTQLDAFGLAVMRHRRRLAEGETFESETPKPMRLRASL